ncbi:MAG: AbiJ-NTD4 domain-containing protein, partial [Paraclostridium sp.]
MNFSERFGFKDIKDTVQINSMNDDLRISLWNLFHEFYLTFDQQQNSEREYYSIHPDDITKSIWLNLWKKEIDNKEPFGYLSFKRQYKDIFFELEWYEVYDLMEYIVRIDKNARGSYFKNYINLILEREFSAYRMVDNLLVRNIEEHEITSVEN